MSRSKMPNPLAALLGGAEPSPDVGGTAEARIATLTELRDIYDKACQFSPGDLIISRPGSPVSPYIKGRVCMVLDVLPGGRVAPKTAEDIKEVTLDMRLLTIDRDGDITVFASASWGWQAYDPKVGERHEDQKEQAEDPFGSAVSVGFHS